MRINAHYQSVLQAVAKYEDLLQTVSDDVFILQPKDGSWSYSETFSHIFNANLASLIAAEKCILGTAVSDARSPGIAVKAILFFGMLPPGRYKAPQSMASMVRKISREEASNLIVKFKKKLEDVKGRVGSAKPSQRMKHPRLGMLNAPEWFRFVEIHTIHHTWQLERIRKKLKAEADSPVG